MMEIRLKVTNVQLIASDSIFDFGVFVYVD